MPRTSSIGLAAAATSCGKSARASSGAVTSAGHGAGRAERRAQLAALAVDPDGERADRDHHRVPRPDLHERLRLPARVDPRPRARARPRRARSASGRGRTRSAAASGRRARSPISTSRPRRAAADARRRRARRCRGCRRSCRGCGSAASRPCATPRRARAAARRARGCIASVYVSPAREAQRCRSRATSPSAPATSARLRIVSGRVAVEVELDEQVGAAGDRPRVGPLRLQPQRLVEGAGSDHLHAVKDTVLQR